MGDDKAKPSYGELIAMLQELEWAGTVEHRGELYSACPVCGLEEVEGRKHAPDCRLAKLLSELP